MATAGHLFQNLIISIFLVYFIEKCHANDILGCGGFVKSHVALDFAKIEIGLYTKAGSLKERTECAPTNGYYFLPLYEKGEYVLKVHPPPGWSFEPSQVELLVDGVTDQCSTGQDINFAFNGFGITGRVITAGQAQGPAGIAVQLVNDKGEKRDTLTAVGGDFHFTPVIPGKYTLKASHAKWTLDPAQAVVQVKEGNTVLPAGVLAVKGYDVKGTVNSYGNPMGGSYVVLYSKEDNLKFRVEGCKTALLQGVPGSPICHAVTDASGVFSFGLVPAGEYFLLALSKPPGQNSVTYNINPKKVEFSVKHDSLFIKNAFEVSGFSVVGTLLTQAGEKGGKGLEGARVLKDGVAIGNTDTSGKYTLAALQPGTYMLSFQHGVCEFDDLQLSVSWRGPAVVPVSAARRWQVCGAVSPADTRTLTLLADSGTEANIVRVTTENTGKWCVFLPPATYTIKVEVSESEQREGLQFYPLLQKVKVTDSPLAGILFSQLKAKVTGRVECSGPSCDGIPVMLRPLSADGGYVGQQRDTLTSNGGEYSFADVLPGSVSVWVATSSLCWQESAHNVAVVADPAVVPVFKQTGYVLAFHSSHDIEVEYNSANSVGVFSVPSGASQQCVAKAELYTLRPRGPHLFKPPQATADLTEHQDPAPSVSFVAVAHAVIIRVLSPKPVTDLVLRLGPPAGPDKAVGPLVPLEQPGGQYAFEHTLYLADREVSSVTAVSSSLLFSPGGRQEVSGRATQAGSLTLRARIGLTLAGKVVPPVPGVLVTLTGGEEKLTYTTTADGTYSFGPLDAATDYTVTAEKDSYVFGERDKDGNIAAHKLAEITVELVDDTDNTPLQGALVSVSGGSYRRNSASGRDGRLRFAGLAPDQYYVKPIMKEYRFSPQHHILHLTEGKTRHVTLRGVRVAWSCMGSLVSLGGLGWAGRALRAAPLRADGCHAEEATTEPSGAFRIRGLLPNCVYELRLKESDASESLHLKLVKAPPTLEVKNNKDIENVRLIAIQPIQITDTNVLVYTPNIDHYKTLRLSLVLENTPHSPVYTTKLDATGFSQYLNPGLMYVLPRLPADNKSYVLQLESALSKSTHSYTETKHYFNSDGKFKYFNIDFTPKVKSSDQELRQTSFLVVPLLGLLLVLYSYRELVVSQLTALVASALRAQPRAARVVRERELLDKASIDHILSTVNAAGKRTAKKKAQ